jgi:hypothetical protein
MAYSQCEPITTFPWTEGFENTETIPPCWEQEIENSTSWQWVIVPATTGTPSTAYEGTHKARIFLDFIGLPFYATTLITPMFDFTMLKDPVLKFWHTQINNGLGSLSVYYKNALDAEWILLNSWAFESILDWQEEIIMLPNTSSHYQIAFEGGFRGGGSADVQLDAISISGEPNNIEPYLIDQYSLTPNPTMGELRITSGELRIIGIDIYDVLGRKQYIEYKNDGILNISHLPSGIYFMKTQYENNRVQTFKLMKL